MIQNVEVHQNHNHNYDGNSVSRCFPEILGFAFSPKYGVQNGILLLSAKVVNISRTKLNGSSRVLLTLNPSCLQSLVGFSNRPHQKLNNV